QQLENLQSQVVQTQRNQAVTNETVTQMKATPVTPANPVGAAVVKMLNGRPIISSADGRDTLGITGRLHLDAGAYSWKPDSKGTVPQNFNDGVNARRARLGVTGKYAGDWDYAFIMDFGGSTDNSSTIENAYVAYNGFRPFQFTLGYIDVSYTLAEATSSNNILFVERASSQVVAANLAAGD